ncbi:metal-dependent hydrolase [Haloarchaeobius amylolyticus]|uniref:metal-dependent hydrolase n=1 Tax=Haloarchaeobius amylolyticus TaxID=1198296 RepID=UPI00226FD181|nr:metal-dependent hydrolase [Haloarchaeobius amylolyticus]
MYRTGHYGVSLLAYAPVGAAMLLADRPAFALLGGAIVLGLSRVPDLDHQAPFIQHRGPTHTLAFALLVGGAAGVVGYYGAPALGLDAQLLAGFCLAMGAYGILAHLLGDVLTPAGVPLFWPLSSRTYSVYVTRADNRVANWLLLALGVFVTVVTAVAVARVA